MSSIPLTNKEQVMSDSHSPSALEILDSLLPLVTGVVLAAPMFPGFLLTVPALLLATVVVVAPLVAIAALAALAGAILAIPYLLVRAIRSVRARWAARMEPARTAMAI
jgi:hypothetical protein